MLGGGGSIIVGCLVASLPRELKVAKENQAARRDDCQPGKWMLEPPTGNIGDALNSTCTLLTNAPFMFICAADGLEWGVMSIISTYSTKYVEDMFGISTGTAAMSAGAVVVLAGVGGQILGGIWVGKTDPSIQKQLKFCITALSISLLCSFTIFYHCDETLFVGANLSYNKAMARPNHTLYTGDDLDLDMFDPDNFQHECFNVSLDDAWISDMPDEPCACDLSQFQPLCINGLSYYNPCYAGCNSDNITAITECSCIPHGDMYMYTHGDLHTHGDVNSRSHKPALTVEAGSCPSVKPCYYQVFCALYFFVLFFTFVNGVPSTNITLRIVPPNLRTHAMGINILSMRLIGTIPGPIIGGVLIDNACSLWQTTCGDRGSCRLYDRYHLMLTWLLLHIVYKVLGILCWVGAYLTYKPKSTSGDVAGPCSGGCCGGCSGQCCIEQAQPAQVKEVNPELIKEGGSSVVVI